MRNHQTISLGIAALLVLVSGCQSLQTKEAENAITHTKFQSCSLIYRHFATGTSREIIVTAQYPAKTGRAGHARVEVIVLKNGATGKPSWVAGLSKMIRDHVPGVQLPEGVEEAYGLDVPLAELERAIHSLADTGYFVNGHPEGSEAQIDLTVDGQHSNRGWQTVRGIEAIASKAKHEGDLVSVSGMPQDLLKPMVRVAVNASPPPIPTFPTTNPAVFTAANGYQAVAQPALSPWPNATPPADTARTASLVSGTTPITTGEEIVRLPQPAH
jgi:hypothetical protein